MKSTPTRDTSWASDNHLRRAALASEGVDRSPQLIYSIPGRVEMILGWWRDQIQDLEVLSGSDGTHVNEPKHQENQESREKNREPATPQTCPEVRTVTPSPGPSTRNARDASSARAADHAGDRHAKCGTRRTCDICGTLRKTSCVRACTITVGPAVTSDLSSQEHRPPDSPEESMLVPAWLWETIQHQENQESREKPREPTTPQPCPEARTVTPSPAPSTRNTRGDSGALATDHAGDRHATCGTRLTCGTCGRSDSCHTRDTSFICEAWGAQDTDGTHGNCDTCDTRGTQDTSVTRGSHVAHDTHRTHGTQDNHITCDACHTNGTQDISG
ncbi:hypothetical protein AB1E18_010684 [Capra hircus]